jgi:glutathione synthase/RimK-type ligase-like ATP-grasp enzyme
MLKLALATSAQLPELNEDDRLLLAELRARGAEAGPAVWDDPQVRWQAFDRVVIRSCWDYHRRLPEFLEWLERLERLAAPLWNPAPLVRANAHKSYLGELSAAGFPVVPTAAVARGSGASLAGLLHERGWSDVVVKPAVSASAFGTRRVSLRDAADPRVQGSFAELLASGDALVQPYLEEIGRRGEWSFVFFGGSYSHAVLKVAAEGDFRVQHEFGGDVRVESPARSLVDAAEKVAGADGAGADRAVPLSFVRSRGGLPVRGRRLHGAALRRRGQSPCCSRTRLSSFATSVG